MDQFAVIRAKARALREEAEVADSLTAIEVVRRVAAHRGLDIRAHPPDYHELEGAHGVLDRGFGQILVRNNLGDDELAEVVAHEIGHFCVHEGSERGYYPRANSVGGDPSQRIETYGIKERREAQANSFGRELILPRPLARRLFTAGMSAARISTVLNVRYELTLQQLADGLLLPDLAVEPPKPDAAPDPCNDSQQRAVSHRGTPFLVRAGPGTGKTKTLTARIVELIQEGIPAENILALTFSNKAARELSERVQRAAGPSAVNIWTGTFHAFGLDTIRKHHNLFGVSNDPKVVDASESVAMLEEALPALDLQYYLNLFEPALALRDILRAISRAKDEMWTPERYFQSAAEMRARAVTAEDREAAAKAREVAQVYEHYQRQLIDEGAFDYGDLIMRPTQKMREDSDFRDLMRSRFTHVHVDEYQDVNRASAMFVHEMVGDGSNLWVVGDARQSIYRFRGASAANIARFNTDYPKGNEDGLEENYRSTSEIVDAYSSFGSKMVVTKFAGPSALRAARGASGTLPALFACTDAVSEMDTLAGSIKELELSGVPLGRQTILARSNTSLARFAEELSARSLPVLYLGPLFERAEVKDLLSLLSIIVDDAGTGLVRVGGLPEYQVPLDDILVVIERAAANGMRVRDLLPQVGSIEELSEQGREGLLLLAGHLQGADRGTTPWLALSRYLFDASGYLQTVLTGTAPSDDLRRVAVRQLLDALRAMPLHGQGTPIRRALDRVRHLLLLADERDLRQLPPELDGLDGVRLMTVHASKGLEFEAVHLPGLYAGAVPAANRAPACPPPFGMLGEEDEDAHEAEEECIFFVAMSRAKSHLRIYRPCNRNGRTSNPSRFLAQVPTATGHSIAGIARTKPAPHFPAITTPAAPVELSARDIERYTGCPRRFFYERVLALARWTRAGAYLDAHGCLQSAIQYVRDLEPGDQYDPAQAIAVFEEAWAASGLDQHPFGAAYRRLTLRMLDRLHVSAAGASAQPGEFSTLIGAEKVNVIVDRVLSVGGASVVRTIRSGRQGSADCDKLSATMLLKATRETFGAGVRVENHYLLSGDSLKIEQTARKYDTRIATCAETICSIRAGEYPPVASDFRCPRCAFLFICSAP